LARRRDKAEVAGVLERLARRVPDLTVLRVLADRWMSALLPALPAADLPVTGVSSDYKANNLIFASAGRSWWT